MVWNLFMSFSLNIRMSKINFNIFVEAELSTSLQREVDLVYFCRVRGTWGCLMIRMNGLMPVSGLSSMIRMAIC